MCQIDFEVHSWKNPTLYQYLHTTVFLILFIFILQIIFSHIQFLCLNITLTIDIMISTRCPCGTDHIGAASGWALSQPTRGCHHQTEVMGWKQAEHPEGQHGGPDPQQAAQRLCLLYQELVSGSCGRYVLYEGTIALNSYRILTW